MGSLLFAEATHIREQAKIDAARITQASGNERRGAETALQQFSASLNNSRALDAAGSNIDDLSMNIARNLDAAAAGRLGSRIRAAEEIGASTAAAAAAGVGGSSVDLYNANLRLTRSINEEQIDRNITSDVYLTSERKGEQIKSAVAAFDNNVYQAPQDFNVYVDHKKPSMFEQIVGIAGTAAATYFGGPQAGAAVMGIFEARQASRNGDFGGASNAIIGAVQNGFGAAKTIDRVGGGDSLWGSVKSGIKTQTEKSDIVVNTPWSETIYDPLKI